MVFIQYCSIQVPLYSAWKLIGVICGCLASSIAYEIKDLWSGTVEKGLTLTTAWF